MNPTTNQPQMQEPNAQPQTPQQDPTKQANQAAANLSFVNTMQEHLLKYKAGQQAQNSPQAPKTAQGSEETTEPTDNAIEEKKDQPDITKELTDFKKEIEGMITSQIGDLKREIQTMVSEEESKDNGENQQA